MISKEKFEKFRLKPIIDKVEQVSSYEYYGEIWDGEVYSSKYFVQEDKYRLK